MGTNESLLSITPYKRVLQLAHHPTKEEFSQVALVTGGFSLIIGLLGMLVYALSVVAPG